VRGDEVVSLGWCFWHRGCFGCLVCGGKLSLPRTSRGDNGMKWNSAAGPDGEQGGRKKKRMIGVELDKIPLCGVCEIETEGETQGQVLERGLEAVSRFDGGLSRDRLDMLSVEPDDVPVQPSRHKIRSPKRLRGSTEIDRELKRFTNGSGRQLVGLISAERFIADWE
jgi:hypothetical protein